MIIPVMIQNPAKRLFQTDKIAVEVANYHVVQYDDITLKPINDRHVKGFIL